MQTTCTQAILEDVNKTLKKGEELDSGLEHLRDCTDQVGGICNLQHGGSKVL
jgi:hypothetical protein